MTSFATVKAGSWVTREFEFYTHRTWAEDITARLEQEFKFPPKTLEARYNDGPVVADSAVTAG